MAPLQLGVEVEFLVGHLTPPEPGPKSFRLSILPDLSRFPNAGISTAHINELLPALHPMIRTLAPPGTTAINTNRKTSPICLPSPPVTNRPLPPAQACLRHIADTLAGKDLPVGLFIGGREEDDLRLCYGASFGNVIQERERLFRTWNTHKAELNGKWSDTPVQFCFFHVQQEEYITEEIARHPPKTGELGKYTWTALEISTPIITDPSEILQGLPTLTNALRTIQETTNVWINSKCGLHLHASLTDKQMDFRVVKRVCALIYLLESCVIYPLCHPSRKRSEYCLPVSEYSIVAREHSREIARSEGRAFVVNLTHEDAIRFAKAQSSPARPADITYRGHQRWDRLVDQISRGNIGRTHRDARLDNVAIQYPHPDYNLDIDLDPEDFVGGGRPGFMASSHGTLEFRYPEASFDRDYIALWVGLLGRVFDIATLSEKKYAAKLSEVFWMANSTEEAGLSGWQRKMGVLGMPQWSGFAQERVVRYNNDLRDLDGQGILPIP